MIVTLTGENDTERDATLAYIVRVFVEQHNEMAVEHLDGEETSYERMIAAVESMPFLAARKLVVLRAPGSSKDFAEKFDTFVQRVADMNDVVLIEPKLDKRLTYYKQLKKFTDFREFIVLDTEGLVRYVVAYVKEQDGAITPSAARLLVERTGASQLGLRHELDKLISYDPRITVQSVELLTDKTPQSTVFNLLEAAFAGDVRRLFSLYEEQRALKVEPQQIISMLAWQLHTLALVKCARHRTVDEIALQAKLKPFVVRKSQGIVRTISLAQLRKLIVQLREFDVRTKSEGIIADEAVRYYLLQLVLA